MRERGGAAALRSAASLAWMAWCLAYVGDLADATERAEEARRIAEASQHDLVLAMAYSGVGRPHLIRGEFQLAVSWLSRSVEICRRGNFAPLFFLVASDLGPALALSGSVAAGLALLEEATAQSAALSVRPTHAWNVTMLGEVCAMAGRRAQAADLVERGLGFARAHKQRWLEAEALRILGQLRAAAAPVDVAGARAALDEAAAIARDMGLRPLLGRCRLALGRALDAAGEADAARESLEEAAALFSAMDMRFWLDRAKAALGHASDR
jgi:tetratricopeptide (TPR) repeat protein